MFVVNIISSRPTPIFWPLMSKIFANHWLGVGKPAVVARLVGL